MLRILVIGYGNLDRCDDGVAYYVINSLRARLGQPALTEDGSGLEALGAPIDAVFLTQLGAELVDLVANYDQIVFVDAHVYSQAPDLYSQVVEPEWTQHGFTHYMTPQVLLALLQRLSDRAPAGHIVSIRGHDFSFGRQLSPAAGALVDTAVQQVLLLAHPPAA